MALTLACSQRERSDDGSADIAGEPERYSALVVRVVDDGKSSQTIIAREIREREYRREEWTEDGKNRAVIWRPDIGKAFLLDPDLRVYVEIDIGAAFSSTSMARAGNPHDASTRGPADRDPEEGAIQVIDSYFGDTPPPTRVEIQTLAPVSIDGHPCSVYQQKAVFPDGHTETTRRFQARDLSGLLLRVESVAEPGGATTITERRNVRIEAAPDAFIVPGDFKRVEALRR
jgi:hypothetical protein